MQGSKQGPQDAGNSARLLAFTHAFNTHGNYIYGYFCRRVGDVHVAEDLTQDFWTSVYLRLPQEKMMEIRLLQKRAGEIFADYMRRKNVRAFVEFRAELPDQAAPPRFDSASEADGPEAQARFWAMFPGVNLTPIQKTVFWLQERVGYTITQISQMTSVPVSTVHEWIKRVREECKRSLNEET